MSLVLNISTALDEGSVSLSEDGIILALSENEEKMDHARWLHPAIEEIFRKTGKKFQELKAVSVSIGPGSYTGLRIGLAAAKGFCYALNIPLIGVETLKIIALSASGEATELVCPMIDARRNEAFVAVYDKKLIEKIPPLAMILHINSFESLLATNRILFCGDGSKKLKDIISHRNASFTDQKGTAESLALLANDKFRLSQFSDLAYSEPLYLKEFQSSTRKEAW
jgi:tRNA threonylcarbamoyladenosine biosynthesis protein TsaB